jgi:integrase
MSIKSRFKRSIYQLLKHNRDGSFETRGARQQILYQIADELHAGGFKLSNMHGLKQKHIRYLNEQWKERGLGNGTIKNRNSHLRWVCAKFSKHNVVPSNQELGVGVRSSEYKNRSVDLEKIDFSKITNRFILVQIHLQRHLGLRRQEAIKLKPCLADKGDYLELQGSWCKGGRARTVPILTKEARYWLEESKKLLVNKNQSLVSANKNYKQHRDLYDKQVQRAGIVNAHGLRHAYAQERYRKLAGWECPACGGPKSAELSDEQRIIDQEVRLMISEELGHSRIQIVKNYCGR